MCSVDKQDYCRRYQGWSLTCCTAGAVNSFVWWQTGKTTTLLLTVFQWSKYFANKIMVSFQLTTSDIKSILSHAFIMQTQCCLHHQQNCFQALICHLLKQANTLVWWSGRWTSTNRWTKKWSLYVLSSCDNTIYLGHWKNREILKAGGPWFSWLCPMGISWMFQTVVQLYSSGWISSVPGCRN